jgi:hypothetical protein
MTDDVSTDELAMHVERLQRAPAALLSVVLLAIMAGCNAVGKECSEVCSCPPAPQGGGWMVHHARTGPLLLHGEQLVSGILSRPVRRRRGGTRVLRRWHRLAMADCAALDSPYDDSPQRRTPEVLGRLAGRIV